MKIQSRRNHGLSFLGAIIVFACVILLGALLIKILLKVMDKVPPPSDPSHQTNIVSVVSSQVFHSMPAGVSMPAFQFDASVLQPSQLLQAADVLIERSTNLVDWEPAWRIGDMSEFNFAADTNPPAPQCFYRAVILP